MKYKNIKLGEVAEITMGQSPKSTYYNKEGMGIPFIQGVSTFEDNYPKIETYTTKYNKEAQKGDLLFSVRAPVGRINVANQTIAIGRGLASLKVKKGYSKSYIYYLFKKIGNQLDSIGSGTVFSSINKKELINLKIRVPEKLHDQCKIADRLRKIDEEIEINNQINDNLLDLVDTLFDNIIKCSILYKATLNDIGTIAGGGTPSKKVNVYWNGKIPWLTPKDLSKSHSIFTSKGTRFITEYGLKESSARLFPAGTVLFSSRAPIGYISIAKNNISTSQGFKSIIPNKGYSPEFIYELLKKETPLIVREANGSTFKEISGTRLKAHIVNIPSKEKAKYFDNSALSIFKLISKNENENKILKNLKKELLNKIF